MKKFRIYISIALLFSLLFSKGLIAQVEVTMEDIKAKCKGIPYENRIRITVSSFKVSTTNARGEFGGELAAMLSNALQEVNCFRVLESLSNSGDLMDEIGFGQSGYTNSGSSPQAGQMLGAQAIVIGEVTEFAEGENTVGAFGVEFGKNKASVGFIVKVVNPQTREIVFSKSVETESISNGKRGVTVGSFKLAGKTKNNTAISDAVEKGIIEAVYALVSEKDNIPLPDANSGLSASKNWDRSNCVATSSDNAPSVMVIIPETHIQRFIPDPAGETEMINQFIKAGFKVIDPAVYATARKGAIFQRALEDPVAAASLGADFGADIIIIGEGISEFVSRDVSGMVSCRARVEARAVQTSNGQILAANGLHAGAVEVSESGASKSALKNAGNAVANDFLEQLCTGTVIPSAGGGSLAKTTTLKLFGTDFTKMKRLTDLLKQSSAVEEVNRTSFGGGNAILEVKHEGSADDILDIIASKASSVCEITGFQGSEIEVKMK